MTLAITWSIVMVGLVLLALIGRDAWLRTLDARRRALTEEDAATIRAVGERCGRIEATLKDHHDRLVVQERKLPAVRRA